jgi:hypothetical protein
VPRGRRPLRRWTRRGPRYGTTPQLFLSGLVVDGSGKVATYGSLYFWNQPSDEGNHTPAWEYFNVPPPPPPQAIPK